MPISLRRVLRPLLYSAERVIANLLFGMGSCAGTGLGEIEEAGSSLTLGCSGEGSSWSWNSRRRVEVASRSSALPLSGSSFGGFESWSSAFPLSGISLTPQRLFSSISCKEKFRCSSIYPVGAVGARAAASCSARRRADRLFRKMQVTMRMLSRRNIMIPEVIPAMLVIPKWFAELDAE